VRPGTLRLLACKQSWDGAALVVRLQEMAGSATAGELALPRRGERLALRFRPYEIKTLRREPSGQWREVGLVREC
jgi:hypothetical protein